MDASGRETGGTKHIAVVVVHGVGETDTGWINDYIVDPIGKRRTALQFTQHSELHRLVATDDADDARAKFSTLVRRGTLGHDRIGFIEMLWADLSRVAKGPVAYIAATLQLMFEAPDVLARAFMRKRWRGLHGLIAFLVLTSSRLLNWFIIGLNVTVFACAAFMTVVWLLRGANFLPSSLVYSDSTIAYWLSPVILGLLMLGGWLFATSRRDEIGLREFGRGLVLSSGTILAYVVLATAQKHWPVNFPFELPPLVSGFVEQWQLSSDFDRGRNATFLVWLVWCFSTLGAMGLLLLVALARTLGWKPKDPIPLVATWAAIFNILIQAIVVKLIISPLSITMCTQLRQAYRAANGATEDEAKVLCDVEIPSGIFFFTLFETIFILGGLVCILILRRSASQRAEPGRVPRLIVHPLLIAIAAVTVTVHILVFLEHSHNLDKPLQAHVNLLGYPEQNIGYFRLPSEWRGTLVWLVPIYIIMLRYFHTASAPIIHIARELVDHQYRDRRRWLGFLRGGSGRAKNDAVDCPRRAPIAARLDAIMDTLIAGQKIDKLVLLTHSQGSVIAFDYLRSRTPNENIGTIGEIHVVTMGSPLTHIYGYYFDEYARPVRQTDLNGNVVSWTNFWRIDDPIGNEVKAVSGDFITNRMLGPGGHINYWREPEVQMHICKLLEVPQTQLVQSEVSTH